ncbi:MAG TPA: hypothetical protein VK816_07585, partial [Jatrophihabitantaceae bacterium]|nr:hypothetical protein [Jatrophihabitantaceae bacterium]
AEGVGDHALEYMTGGIAVILGPAGRNLAAGMSGGKAFVLDLDPAIVNPELVDIDELADLDAEVLRTLVERHAELTESNVATGLLADWDAAVNRFSLVIPRDFKRVLEATARAREAGDDVDAAVMAAARS